MDPISARLADPRLARFKRAGMVLGGCPLDDKGEPVESPGWIGRFADVLKIDRGNLSKVLLGQRNLSTETEDRLEAGIRGWVEAEKTRIRIPLRVAAEIATERQFQRMATELDNDGPAPQIG
jgi:hypothetical protein